MTETLRLTHILETHENQILKDWIQEQLAAGKGRKDLLKESELRSQSAAFLQALIQAMNLEPSGDIQSRAWTPVRDTLGDISSLRARVGMRASETATFVFSLKQPLFSLLQKEFAQETDHLLNQVWFVSVLIDKLGLFTMEIYQKSREEVINRQQQEMLELSTPVVKLWDGILGLPMIGTLDSNRSQMVMESLLQAIVEQSADVAIIDITGVPTVDTLTAQHLLKAIAAARLMGAECIISGIRPQIAQTIVHLGIELHNIQTKATLAEALSLALRRRGLGVQNLSHGSKMA